MFSKIIAPKVDNRPIYCHIVGIGHSANDSRLRSVSQEEFIKSLPDKIQQEIISKKNNTIIEVAEEWSQKICGDRTFFDGDIADLAMLAVDNCFSYALESGANVDPYGMGFFDNFVVDAIIGATNTGPNYPSLADCVKEKIAVKYGDHFPAMCFDVTEACTAGSVALAQGRALVASGMCQTVLVVCAEKATTLTIPENWQGSNLFGDAAFAVLLQASYKSTDESFHFFNFDSLPYDGKLELIKKVPVVGFQQNGPKVHKFVADTVVPTIVDSVERAKIKPSEIKHFIPHQPSVKTVAFLEERLTELWPNFAGVFHKSQGIGNASSASFGHLMSKKFHEGIIKPGELIVTATFGAGLSLAVVGLHL